MSWLYCTWIESFVQCSISQHSSPYLYIELSSKLELIELILIGLILQGLIFAINFNFGHSILLEVVYSQPTIQIVGKRIFSKLLYPHSIYTFGCNFSYNRLH